jgi:hypothetical protein
MRSIALAGGRIPDRRAGDLIHLMHNDYNRLSISGTRLI